MMPIIRLDYWNRFATGRRVIHKVDAAVLPFAPAGNDSPSGRRNQSCASGSRSGRMPVASMTRLSVIQICALNHLGKGGGAAPSVARIKRDRGHLAIIAFLPRMQEFVVPDKAAVHQGATSSKRSQHSHSHQLVTADLLASGCVLAALQRPRA